MLSNQNSLLNLLRSIGVLTAIIIFSETGASSYAQGVTAKSCLDDFLINAELASDRYAFASECEIVETNQDDVAFRKWFSVRNASSHEKQDLVEYFDVHHYLLLNRLTGGEERALLYPKLIFYAFGQKPQHLRGYPRWDVVKEESGKTTGMRMMYRVPNLFTLSFQPNTGFATNRDSVAHLRKLIAAMKLIEETEDANFYYGFWNVDIYGIKVHFSKRCKRLPTTVEGFYRNTRGISSGGGFDDEFTINAFKILTEWKRLENNLYYPTSIANTVYRFSPKGNSGREMHVLAEWSDEVPGMESLTADSLNAEYSSPPGKVLKLQAVLEERLSKRKTEK